MMSATTISIWFFVGSSTSGRAPLLSATSRFWISDDSLKRPPTLLTICSSLNSSNIQCVLPCDENICNFVDGPVELVVDDPVGIKTGRRQLLSGNRQAALDGLFGLRAAATQSLFVIVVVGRRQKDRDGFRIGLGDVFSPLDVDFQECPGAGPFRPLQFAL